MKNNMERTASKHRVTKETDVNITINLDGQGKADVDTGVGFFNHMMELFAFHSGFDVRIQAKGDLDVCDHHTIEDIGITLGQLVKEALGDKKGIHRYGSFTMPMDEVLCNVTLDFSGRPYLVYNNTFQRESIGSYSTEMTEEFLRALAFNAGMTLHVNVYYGVNDHHKAEAIFKALARAMKEAVVIESDQVTSSKGVLE